LLSVRVALIPIRTSNAQQAQLTEAQSSHLHQPPQPPVAGYDHSHLPVPQLHPSLAGLVPQQQQQQQQPPQYQQRPAAPPPPPAPSHYQQAAAQAAANAANGGGQHRDIPVDPVLLGLLPNPPAHFTTSSVRSGGGRSEGGPAGAGGASEQDRQLQAVAAAAAVAVAVAGLARGGGGGGAPAVTDDGGSKSGSSGGKKRKDKGKEKAKADNSIEVVAAGTDQNPAVAAAAGADSTSSQKQKQQPQPSGSAQEQKESLQDLYSHVTRILGPSHKRHNNNNNNDPYTGRKVPPSHGSNGNANGTIGAEGVEKAQGGFYEQLRSKWMSTKDLRQLSEQYGEPLSLSLLPVSRCSSFGRTRRRTDSLSLLTGATYKQGKFSLAEDTTLREAMEQFRLARGLTPADLRRLLVMKRDVRKPLAHGQSQNEIWEYLAQALGDRPLLSIYNHVKLLVAGDPIEASANANGTPQPPAAAAAEGAASAESTPGPGPGPNTDANAVASGSGSGAPKGPTPKPNFAVAPGPSLEGVLGDANRKGRWTPEEDQSLARLLKELGCSWNEIGRQLGRSGVACRDRWTKQLNNGLALGMTPKGESVPVQKAKEGKWSEAEVEQLKALHAEFGSQWKLISTKMGGTRTSTQCRTKWCVFFSSSFPAPKRLERFWLTSELLLCLRTDYIARREAAGLAKGEADQAASPAPPAQGPKEPASKEDWRWHASDGSRLIHT
jgi:transposase-like protein